MKTTLMMTALLASLSLGAVAQAQAADPAPAPDAVPIVDTPPRPDFATLDADGNGGVTLEEMQAQALARFAAADTDGDAGLSSAEITAQEDQRRADRIARMIADRDTDGDGLLQAAEMAPKADRMTRMFDRMDADSDGSISEAEFAEMPGHMGHGAPKRGVHVGGGHGDRDGKHGPRG